MKRAIVTIAIGDTYRKLADVTHPTIKAYAKKIDADFIDIDQRCISSTTPHFEKFQIFDLLNKYKRIAFIDTDILIREDCPDLFNLVPFDQLGAFNEGAFAERAGAMMMVQKQYQSEIEWDGTYYNTGVMVLSRRHKFLFRKPEMEISNFYEQSYLNLLFQRAKVNMFNLEYKFNRMTVMDRFTGEHRLASYIVHYAGCPNFDFMLDIMKKDRTAWAKAAPDFKYKRNIDIQVHGGLGDEICAEPAIRYVIEKAYPDANINITSWFPRVFMHLPVPIHAMNKFRRKEDTPYYRMDTMATHGCPSWRFISPNLLHCTDYSSMMCLRGTIPNTAKRIKLQVLPEDDEEVQKIVGDIDFDKAVLVHPGRGWPSKTFPASYWEQIVEKLCKSHPVIVIGKDVSDEQGTTKLKLPKEVVNAVNLLSLGGLISIINKAHVLLSNDSSPVHIAGAFDNHIVLIPTCKHPDHVLPYRYGRQNFNAVAVYKKLTCEAINSTPTEVHGQTIDWVKGDIMDYLPDVDDVVAKVEEHLALPCHPIHEAS